jgi:hypothetical protein
MMPRRPLKHTSCMQIVDFQSTGVLDRAGCHWLYLDDLHSRFFETSGNPKGKPVVYLRGGPGAGMRHGFALAPNQLPIAGLRSVISRGLSSTDGSTLFALQSIRSR